MISEVSLSLARSFFLKYLCHIESAKFLCWFVAWDFWNPVVSPAGRMPCSDQEDTWTNWFGNEDFAKFYRSFCTSHDQSRVDHFHSVHCGWVGFLVTIIHHCSPLLATIDHLYPSSNLIVVDVAWDQLWIEAVGTQSTALAEATCGSHFASGFGNKVTWLSAQALSRVDSCLMVP